MRPQGDVNLEATEATEMQRDHCPRDGAGRARATRGEETNEPLTQARYMAARACVGGSFISSRPARRAGARPAPLRGLCGLSVEILSDL